MNLQLPSNYAIEREIEVAQSHGDTDQTKLLAHCLRRSGVPRFISSAARYMMHTAVIVGIDAEWFEYDNSRITELGLSILLPTNFSHEDSPWDIIRKMHNYHVRIRRNAYLVNSELCNGYPEDFQFGQTTFVNELEVKDLLKYAFSRKQHWKHEKLLPVILVGHAVDNDIEMLKKHFNFDIHAQGVVVATIDTQQMAREAGFVNSPAKMRLSHLMSKFGIFEKYLHNAGNDNVCTMVAAILMACSVPPGDHAKSYSDLKTHKHAPGSGPAISLGVPVFCTNCNSMSHFVHTCNTQLHCDFCQSQAGRGILLRSHHDSSCIARAKCMAAKIREAQAKARGVTIQKHLLPQSTAGNIPGSLAAHLSSPFPTFVPRTAVTPSFTPTSVPRHLKLSMPKYPFPCAACIMSADPKRHKTEYAYTHLEENCTFERVKQL